MASAALKSLMPFSGSNVVPLTDEESKRKAIEEAGRSKSGLPWGPSHSMDSDDTSKKRLLLAKKGNTETTTKTPSTQNSDEGALVTETPPVPGVMGRFLESAAGIIGFSDGNDKQALTKKDSLVNTSGFTDSFCTPCKGALEQPCLFSRKEQLVDNSSVSTSIPQPRTASVSTPAERRRQRYAEKKQKQDASKPMPVDTLEVTSDADIERSISELTMKSSYGEATAKVAENRRMAYYAVGKHHRGNSGRGGNRRCYFTGKLILGGAPFFAGSVQQGLRTLVVFCLPSALGLPKSVQRKGSQAGSASKSGPKSLLRTGSKESSIGVVVSTKADIAAKLGIIKRLRTQSAVTTGSRVSSLDDMSLSIVEEDLDPNWELDRDFLLQHLPDPDESLLQEMADMYPQQFETLPVQVRSPHCWRLFVKFCFFSGLPIAEGESHYKVRDDVAMEVYGEEIVLSHDVMEAVNGESAEILRLPNQKTFRYLRKHYTQQSAKLSDAVFCRSSWELVMPEV